MNKNKIKKQYIKEKTQLCICGLILENVYVYKYAKSLNIRNFSTIGERRHSEGSIIDYNNDYKIRIRGKRIGELIDCWDEKPSDVYNKRKSWKSNSKRKKQWKNK